MKSSRGAVEQVKLEPDLADAAIGSLQLEGALLLPPGREHVVLRSFINVHAACMPLLCTPSDSPELWLQYDPEAEVIQIYLNAENLPYQDWRSAVFELDVYRRTFGAKRSVYAYDDSGELCQDTLASWVTAVKPAVRGNPRGILYFCKEKGWQRLHTLLASITEVHGHDTLIPNSYRLCQKGLVCRWLTQSCDPYRRGSGRKESSCDILQTAHQR